MHFILLVLGAKGIYTVLQLFKNARSYVTIFIPEYPYGGAINRQINYVANYLRDLNSENKLIM